MGSSICKGMCPSQGSGLVEVDRVSVSNSEDSTPDLMYRPTTSTAPINVSPVSQLEREVMTNKPKSRLYFLQLAREESLILFAVNEVRHAPLNKTVADCKVPLVQQNQDSNNIPGPSTSRK